MSTKSKQRNAFMALFTSVKLALTLLFLLAATSVIGTVIPQHEAREFYIQRYGDNMASLMHLLGVPDMYGAWWFVALLLIFSLNLIVCSLDRIPQVWRIVTQDNLRTDPQRIERMSLRRSVAWPTMGLEEAATRMAGLMAKQGWQTARAASGEGLLLFAQQGAWTRFGVYLVHLSILVILAGALIGSTFGFKGNIMVPESKAADFIFAFHTGEKIPLGFTVRCDSFAIAYYPTGMPKEYRSELSVIEDGRTVLQRSIIVNEPLTYRGITFYQASYQPYKDFIITVTNRKSGASERLLVSPGKELRWEEEGVRLGILNLEGRGEVVQRAKVWFGDEHGEPSIFWLPPGQEAIVQRPEAEYSLTIKQLYATGLQVTKDPGVWWVYGGCGLMLFGLTVAFFLSHRRIWVLLRPGEQGINVLFAGNSNKNKLSFDKEFSRLVAQLPQDGGKA
ncbi:MAG: hypothetical protein BWK76_27945 [Desulfobulbaceae bacterium A2]|nr:MAG: hypothetical protein BWK76_27945 [Desulfobulbaceae bacterium A2]